ncbi:MAG: type IV pilus modification protein PilV [Candidatus Contendobacter sp.]|nr:type IV pilus modification protein PilV [Candidatus Contendobacter sp.]MDG4558113.1 type IV pilus modification protein PilV [Candidatus Contendobacter sp.]
MNGQPRRCRQSGFSLLEVLITLLIIAIGLMGFAAMMLNSMKNNRLTMQRSLATAYAYDIIDCMRVNRAAAVGGSYTMTAFGQKPGSGTVAADDVSAWQDQLGNLLPNGMGKISFPAGGNVVKVEVQWKETSNAGDDATHTWETETTL